MGRRLVWAYWGDHREHPFICLAADALAREGFEVTVVDLADRGDTAAYRHAPLGGTQAGWHGALMIARKLADLSRRQWAMFLALRRLAPEVIIVTRPHPIAAAWLAALLRTCRMVYYPFELLGEQHGGAPRLWLWLERQFLRHRVDAVITQNAPRAAVYAAERGSRVAPVIVHNYKRERVVTPSGRLRSALGLPPEVRIVLYEGLLVQGRCLLELVESASLYPESTVLVLMGPVSDWWRSAAPRLTPGRVFVAAPVPHHQVLEYVADADAGVIIYDDAVRNNRFCEPGKLSDYVFARVPILAPDYPTIGAVVRQYDVGCVFRSLDPADIADAVRKLLARPRGAWRVALDQASRRLTWESQQATLLQAVAPSTAGEPSSA